MAVKPDETLRKFCVYALGIVLANTLWICGGLLLAAMQGNWQALLLHSGKCLLITGWVAYRWISLVRRRYLITRPWQAGKPQQIKTILQHIAILAAMLWPLVAGWHVYQRGIAAMTVLQPALLVLPVLTLLCFITIDIINFTVIEKVVLDAGEGDVSRYTY